MTKVIGRTSLPQCPIGAWPERTVGFLPAILAGMAKVEELGLDRRRGRGDDGRCSGVRTEDKIAVVVIYFRV